jgi:hypothetical protein
MDKTLPPKGGVRGRRRLAMPWYRFTERPVYAWEMAFLCNRAFLRGSPGLGPQRERRLAGIAAANALRDVGS